MTSTPPLLLWTQKQFRCICCWGCRNWSGREGPLGDSCRNGDQPVSLVPLGDPQDIWSSACICGTSSGWGYSPDWTNSGSMRMPSWTSKAQATHPHCRPMGKAPQWGMGETLREASVPWETTCHTQHQFRSSSGSGERWTMALPPLSHITYVPSWASRQPSCLISDVRGWTQWSSLPWQYQSWGEFGNVGVFFGFQTGWGTTTCIGCRVSGNANHPPCPPAQQRPAPQGLS